MKQSQLSAADLDEDSEPQPGPPMRPWATAALVLALGALGVAAVVALVVPDVVADPSGLSGKVVAGARLDRAVDLSIDGASDVRVSQLTVGPQASVGWHQHTGPTLITIVSGVASFYDAEDPSCTRRTYRAGQAVVEQPDHPHLTRNEGPEPLVMYVVGLTPEGEDTDSAVPASPNCRS